MLAFYRAALAARRTLAADVAPTLTWLGGPDGVLAFSRGNFGCTVNLSDQPVPAIGPVLLSSAPVRRRAGAAGGRGLDLRPAGC